MIAGQKDVSRRHIGALLELAAGQNGKSLNLPGGIRAVNKNEFLVFEKNRSIRKREMKLQSAGEKICRSRV